MGVCLGSYANVKLQVKESVRAGNQVMVFVHSRKDTFKTAEKLFELAQAENQMGTSSLHFYFVL